MASCYCWVPPYYCADYSISSLILLLVVSGILNVRTPVTAVTRLVCDMKIRVSGCRYATGNMTENPVNIENVWSYLPFKTDHRGHIYELADSFFRDTVFSLTISHSDMPLKLIVTDVTTVGLQGTGVDCHPVNIQSQRSAPFMLRSRFISSLSTSCDAK